MTELKLYRGVLLDTSYQHSIDFSNVLKQQQYFNNLLYKDYSGEEGLTFIREKNNVIQIGLNYFEAKKCNYLSFVNDNDTKVYYAFIDEVVYISENNSRIFFTIDVIQTFMFDYTIESAFVEREHQDRWELSSTGTEIIPRLYNHIDEDLNLGEDYKTVATYKKDIPVSWIVLIGTKELESVITAPLTPYGIEANLFYYVIPVLKTNINDNYTINFVQDNNTTKLADYKTILQKYSDNPTLVGAFVLGDLWGGNVSYNMDNENKILTITQASVTPQPSGSIYFAPVNVGDETKPLFILSYLLTYDKYVNHNLAVEIPPLSINYYRKTKPSKTTLRDISYETKLLTYPYQKFMLVVNKISKDFKLEYSRGNRLFCIGNFGLSPSALYYLENYNTDSNVISEFNKNECIIDNSLNEVLLTNDVYKQYILTKRASVVTGAVSEFLGTVGKSTTVLGAPQGALLGAQYASKVILGELGKRIDLKNTPDTVKNGGNNGNFAFLTETYLPNVLWLKAQDEYLNQANDYFNLFGYKCLELKKPNIKSRYYYNFIKTNEINIKLPFSKDYEDEIKNIYNNGITFWHYRDDMTFNDFKMFDYTYENIEVSII